MHEAGSVAKFLNPIFHAGKLRRSIGRRLMHVTRSWRLSLRIRSNNESTNVDSPSYLNNLFTSVDQSEKAKSNFIENYVGYACVRNREEGG